MLLFCQIAGIVGACYLFLRQSVFGAYSQMPENLIRLLGFSCYGINGAVGLMTGHLAHGISFLVISIIYFAGFLRWSGAR
jgi:hypothetical protein